MTIPIKWHNEITRFLKVEIDIQENISLHEYFNVTLKTKNISNSQMDLYLEICDTSAEYFHEKVPMTENEIFDFKGKRYYLYLFFKH